MKSSKNNQPPSDRASKILAAIEKQQLTPKSRWTFVLQDSLLWVCWVSSVVVGALALAVLIMAFVEGMYGFYEATHNTWLAYTLEQLPYVWFVVFALVVLVAYRNVRRTERGYRYPFWQVVVSSVVCSVLAGALFYWLGLGYVTDHLMGKHMPIYTSQAETELQVWQAPAGGRLAGAAVTVADDSLQFIDIDNTDWSLETNELSLEEKTLLTTGETVKLVGIKDSDDMFHVCGVMAVPQSNELAESTAAANELRANLQELKMYRDMEAVAGTPTTMRCMELPLLDKMP